MLAEDMSAKITPLPNGKLHIINEGYVDPGGAMPSWSINFVQRNAPYATLMGMGRRLKQDELISSKAILPFDSAQPTPKTFTELCRRRTLSKHLQTLSRNNLLLVLSTITS